MMSNFTPGAWRYFRNSDGTYSVFPVEVQGLESGMLAEVFSEGITDPEANARVIASSPELYHALNLAVETLRATELFMTCEGLKTDDLNEIIRVASELLDRIDAQEDL